MKYKILLILFLIALLASLILSFLPIAEICNPEIGCEVIHHSSYNYIFGIQNSYFGILFFALGALLIHSQIKNATKQKKNLIHAAVIIGSIIALYFLYLQQFILKSYCIYCLTVDVSMLLALLVIIFNWKK